LVIRTDGHNTREVCKKFMDKPLSVPLKAPSFIISVNKKLVVLGLAIRLRFGAAWQADTNLSTPEIHVGYTIK